MAQKTICRSVHIEGPGVHTGKHCKLSIYPAVANMGISFQRRDTPFQVGMIRAQWPYVRDTKRAVTLSNEHGTQVKSVQHLMAAMYGMEINNAIIEVSQPEIPCLDGSALEFAKLLKKAGRILQPAPKPLIRIKKKVEIYLEGSHIELHPANKPKLSVSIDFPNTEIGAQTFLIDLTMNNFIKEIAPARNFGFLDFIEDLNKEGLALGASTRNTVLLNHGKVINEENLRFENEFARSKALDLVGDLALIGMPIVAEIRAHRPGHDINHQLIKKLFSERDAWEYCYDGKFSHHIPPQKPNRSLRASNNFTS